MQLLQIGDYNVDLDTSLGGAVFKAQHRVTKTEVKAKRIPVSRTDKMRIAREVEDLMAASGHSRIVTVLYTEHKDGSLWLITEYCKAGSIHEYLTTHTVTDYQAQVIIQDVVEAVCHLHRLRPQGRVQQTVRTDHLLVTVTDGQPRVKLNVATSTLLDSSVKTPSLVDDPSAPETSYLPPEMFTNNPSCQYATAADVFSLGLVIWSILHRKPKKGLEAPMDGADPIGYSWVTNHAREWTPFTVNPGDGLLEVLVVHMTIFDPNERPGIQMVKDILVAYTESKGSLDRAESDEKLKEAYDRMREMCDRYQQLSEQAELVNQQLLKRNEALTVDHEKVQAEYTAMKERHTQVERQAQQYREVMDEESKAHNKLKDENDQLIQDTRTLQNTISVLNQKYEDEKVNSQRHQKLLDEQTDTTRTINREKWELSRRIDKMVNEKEEKTQFERVIECLDYRSIVGVVGVLCILVSVLAVLVNLSIQGRYCQLALEKKHIDFTVAAENYKNKLNELGEQYNIIWTALQRNKKFLRQHLNKNTAPVPLHVSPLMNRVATYLFLKQNTYIIHPYMSGTFIHFGNDHMILDDRDRLAKYEINGDIQPKVLEVWNKRQPDELRSYWSKYVLNNGSIIMRHGNTHNTTYLYSEEYDQRLHGHLGDFGSLGGVVGNYVIYCKKQPHNTSVYSIQLYSTLSHELVATLPRTVRSTSVSVCEHPTGYLAVSDYKARTLDIYTPDLQHVTRVQLEKIPLSHNAVAAVGDVIVVASQRFLTMYSWAGERLDVLRLDQLGLQGWIVGVGGSAGGRLLLAEGALGQLRILDGADIERRSLEVYRLHVYEVY